MTSEQMRVRIRAKMAEKGLTYRDVAKKCGVSASIVFRFLSGVGVHSDTLDKLKSAVR